MTPEFLTVPEELLKIASVVLEYFREYGYSVTIEKQSIDYPYTPTLVCKRGSTTLIVEVVDSIYTDRIGDWVSYGKSCWGDTRLALFLPSTVSVSAGELRKLHEDRVGLYLASSERVIESFAPADLAVNIDPPRLTRYSNKV